MESGIKFGLTVTVFVIIAAVAVYFLNRGKQNADASMDNVGEKADEILESLEW